MKLKKIILCFISIIILISSIIIVKSMTKNLKSGNNMSSQEIVDKVLNLNSYKAKVFVQVNSNKNQNKYILKQEFNSENGCLQEVVEPENIAGVKIILKNNILSIENSALDLKTVFENYKGLEDSSLDLNNFLNEYKEINKANFEEKNQEIILKVTSTLEQPYIKNKILYINKENGLPSKLLVKDNNQNTTIIIEYNEIELN